MEPAINKMNVGMSERAGVSKISMSPAKINGKVRPITVNPIIAEEEMIICFRQLWTHAKFLPWQIACVVVAGNKDSPVRAWAKRLAVGCQVSNWHGHLSSPVAISVFPVVDRTIVFSRNL